MIPKKFPLVFFIVYGVGSLAMGLGDAFYPQGVGGASSWGIVPGWIREIACFDLCLAFLCGTCVWLIHETRVAQVVTRGLIVGSVLIGSNNLYAYVQSSRPGHLQAVIVHAVVIFCGLVTLAALRQRTPAVRA